jgi:hypothetical protein
VAVGKFKNRTLANDARVRHPAKPKDGVPMGEWLDARGEVWVKSAAGEWTGKK